MSEATLPQQWVTARLANVTQKIADRDHYTPTYVEAGVIMISPKDFDEEGRIDFTNCQFISSVEHERNRRKTDITAGDLVFTRIGARLGKACLVTPDMPEFSLLHSAVMIRTASHRVLPEYLLFVLKGHELQSQIGREIQSIGVPDLGLDKINAFVVTLPPLPQQRKIARILTTVDNLIEKTEALIAKYQAIKQGMMHDLFTRGVDENGHLRPPYEEAPDLYKPSELGWIPREWEVGSIGDIARLVGGFAFSSTLARTTGIRWLKIANVGFEKVLWEESSYLPERLLEEHHDFALQCGDIVMAMTRPIIRGQLKVSFVRECDAPALLNQRVGKLAVHDPDDSNFVYYAVQFSETVRQFELKTLGTDPPNLSSSHVESARLPIPTPKERKAHGKLIASISRTIRNEINSLEFYRSLKTGLMQDLLTGKVRVKADEAEEAAGHA